jgi:hypothetical protein
MQDALIIDAVRSPIGRKNGSLASIRGDELCAQVLNGLVARHDLDPGEIEDVQLGCVTQIGEQGWNLGRMVPLVAGWPETVAGTTVDRQCGSSMQTNFNAAAAIWSEQLDLVVSAGVEMMSRVPMGSNGGDLSDKLLERWQIVPPRGCCERRRALRGRDRPDRPHEPTHGRRLRRRRDPETRHVPGGAGRAEAGLPPGGQGDGRKLFADL